MKGNKKLPQQQEASPLQEAKTIAIQSGYSVLTYPLDYARTLIQVI